MCGIAGQIDFKDHLEHNQQIYKAMQASLRRRGPDAAGMYVNGPAALIHTRLSVVDLEKGSQPMEVKTDDGNVILVYNGELYNTEELRTELGALGHVFLGHSDTEVLLHSYMQWGGDCVGRFNGIFAFAIWDERDASLFFARDRIGVKPFFYVETEAGMLFASELKALLQHPLVQPEIDLSGVAELMLIGPGRTPGYGVFRGVSELRPGSCGRLRRHTGLQIQRYWHLEDRVHTDSLEETVEHVRYLVLDAIQRQLVSDVPLCTFLSGGLDSSLISSIANTYLKEQGKTLHTFSVDYRDNDRYFKASKFQPNSDPSFIQKMNDYLGAEHHLVVLDTEDLVQALYAAVEARDLPGMADVDSSLLLFCKEIKKHATVALSGECADEIFGGYPWYRDKEIREQDGFPWAQSTLYRTSFLRPELAAQIHGADYVDARYRKTLEESSILPGQSQTEQRMKEMVNLNFDWFMQTLLDRKDRMSMYNGLEVRVPFCDYRIAEYLYSVPWEMKDYKGQEKGLLRMAMQDILPEEVLWRKKSPYPKTHNPAYLEAVRRELRNVLEDGNAPLLQIVRKDALLALLEADRATPWYGQLMTTPQTIAYFLQLNHWLKTYGVQLV